VTARDRGSALLWAVVLVQLLMAVTVAGLLVSVVAIAHSRAASVADVAVLAAAQSPTDACAAAGTAAEANGAVLSDCRVEGEDVEVAVSLAVSGVPAGLMAMLGVPDGLLTERARAGPR